MRTDTVRTTRTRAPGSSRTPHERRRIGGGVFTVTRFDHGTHGRLAKSRSTPCDGAATARCRAVGTFSSVVAHWSSNAQTLRISATALYDAV